VYAADVVSGWLSAFALTLVVETPVYAWGLRGRVALARACLAAIALNAATHPIAWMLTVKGSWWAFAAVEMGVFLAEGSLVWLLCRSRRAARPSPLPPLPLSEACALSLVANSLSAGLGLLLA
jgi:hypothetical protein